MKTPNKRKLSELFLRKLKPKPDKFVVWDTHQRGLALLVQPTGFKSWKCIYSRNGRPRWYHVGAADAIGLADARKLAGRVMYEVAEGKDPAADRKANRLKGTFEELAALYVAEYSKKKNKSWKSMDDQVQRHAIPSLGKLLVSDISRADIKAMMRRIDAPISANQTLAYTRSIFAWALREEIIKVNPCTTIETNETTKRDRHLSDRELPLFWKAFDDAGPLHSTALKVLLLTGQRPGEVTRMRSEHIVDGWWKMPGKPDPELGWPGTKNGETHSVWLPVAAQALLEELGNEGMIFAGARGSTIRLPDVMRDICKKFGVEKATPHDLRRTHGTRINALGFGRDAMNRIENHKEGGIADVYDRHSYAVENKKIMEAVATNIMALVEGGSATVIPMRKKI
jgi:integrase